jgi:hypothetical protein
MKFYLAYLTRRYQSNKIEVIHQHFKGLQDILPCSYYGNYLIMNNNGNRTFVEYSTMRTKNPSLDQLNANSCLIQERGVDVTLIAGIDEETINYLEVTPSQLTIEWSDGKVDSAAYTNQGDGDAALHSVYLLEGDRYTVPGTHVEVLYKSEAILMNQSSCYLIFELLQTNKLRFPLHRGFR